MQAAPDRMNIQQTPEIEMTDLDLPRWELWRPFRKLAQAEKGRISMALGARGRVFWISESGATDIAALDLESKATERAGCGL